MKKTFSVLSSLLSLSILAAPTLSMAQDEGASNTNGPSLLDRQFADFEKMYANSQAEYASTDPAQINVLSEENKKPNAAMDKRHAEIRAQQEIELLNDNYADSQKMIANLKAMDNVQVEAQRTALEDANKKLSARMDERSTLISSLQREDFNDQLKALVSEGKSALDGFLREGKSLLIGQQTKSVDRKPAVVAPTYSSNIVGFVRTGDTVQTVSIPTGADGLPATNAVSAVAAPTK